jgi:hypothetical protein
MGVKDWGVTGSVEYMAGRLTQARNENHVQAKSCARAKTLILIYWPKGGRPKRHMGNGRETSQEQVGLSSVT